MPGRIRIVPGLVRDDQAYVEQFAAGGDSDCALLATRGLLERWREELMRHASGSSLGGGRLMLFTGLAGRILGEDPAGYASETWRRTVMEIVLRDLADGGRLKLLGRAGVSPSLVNEIMSVLGELERGMVPAEALREEARSDRRLADLAVCRRQFETALEASGRLDAESGLRRAAWVLAGRDRPVWFPSTLLVHGFTDLTPLQAEVLRWLARGRTEVTLLFPLAEQALSDEERDVLLREQFPDWEVAKEEHPGGPGSVSPLDSVPAGYFSLLEGEGVGLLASLIAREIRASLSDDPTLGMEDIAIVRRAPAAGDEFIAALARYGLPIEEEAGPVLLSLNSVGTLLAALDCVSRDWPRSSVLRLARGVLAGGDQPLADALARLSARAGVIRSRSAWEDLAGVYSISMGERNGADGDGERPVLEAIERLSSGLALIPGQASTSEYLRCLRSFVAHWQLPERWWPAEPGRGNLARYADETRGMSCLFDMLGEIEQVEKSLSRERIWNAGELMAALEWQAGRTRLPARERSGGIKSLGPSAIRGLRLRRVFLVGLAEGEFPRSITENWLLSDRAREALSGPGRRLETRASLAGRERQILRNIADAAGERLYLCWSPVDERGEERPPSPFLSHLLELASPPVKRLRAGEFLPRTMSAAWDETGRLGRMLADLLSARAGDSGDGGACPGGFGDDLAELVRRAGRGTSRGAAASAGGVIKSPSLIEDVGRRFGPGRTISAGALEDYAVCPFLFFCRWLLGIDIDQAPTEDPGSLDLGLAYHQALERFFRLFGRAPLERGDYPVYLEELKRFVGEAFAPLEKKAHTAAAGRLVSLERVVCYRRLAALIQAEIRAAASRGFWRTVHCELGFGLKDPAGLDPASRPEPLVVGEGSAEVRVAGKIDRVDLHEEGCFVVYDYKTGRVPEPKSILSGRSLQVTLYLLAMRRLFMPGREPAGAAYYGIRDLSRRSGLWRSEFSGITGISGRVAGSMDSGQWEAKVAELADSIVRAAAGIRAGDFRPSAEECPVYCDFRGICRREDMR